MLITESRESTLERRCKYVMDTGDYKALDYEVDTRLNFHITVDLIIKKFIKKYKMKNENYL